MRRRGFTLIEVVIVCAIISMLAALVYPNVVAMKSSRERDAAYGNVLRLAQMGREAAIQGGKTYSLSIEGTTLVLKQEEETGGVQDTRPRTETEGDAKAPPPLPSGILVGGAPDAQKGVSAGRGGGSETGGQSASLPEGVTVGEASLDGKPSSSSEFTLHFYPDGRSEGGGFEMVDRSTTRVLLVERNGLATLREGTLPATSEHSWEAGQYEQRTSS